MPIPFEFSVQEEGKEEREDDARRHGAEDEEDGVAEDLMERVVRRDLVIVAETDETRHAHRLVLLEQTAIRRRQHRIERERRHPQRGG